MKNTTTLITILMFAGVLIPICVILLQIFLSKKQNRWLGLILPTIPFCYSIMTVLGFAGYMGAEGESIALAALVIFLSVNIPTIILLLIYFACRRGVKPKAQLDKMNIQDLH